MDTQAQGWDAEAADRAVAVLKAVADPSRYRLLWALSHGEQPVSELARMLGAHVAATSQHLARLRSAGLVTTRREGTRIYYQAAGVRPLLEAAHLTVTEGDGPKGGGPGGEESAPAPRRATATSPALSRRPALGGTP
ncbi:ArsR/SmtB family transcription factor [Streptomyces sp. NPDC088337]|uniref:ArsR/SmtB family transcription factor n=1 Tax=unclassified Streptomyces TaxID=2593676 RepID=UPI002DDAB693|nr:metalloregulator ArsR/SmtB family transcription factor [Streptomyces sp. NBC_01788]WSB29960.1 metalloregulator ArsR/SmtB family transcription factor [Streptomyces sp. NBC_01788]